MRTTNAVRCAKCYIRIEPYEMRVVQHKTTYHQHCFLMVLREAAHRKPGRAQWSLTDTVRRRSA